MEPQNKPWYVNTLIFPTSQLRKLLEIKDKIIIWCNNFNRKIEFSYQNHLSAPGYYDFFCHRDPQDIITVDFFLRFWKKYKCLDTGKYLLAPRRCAVYVNLLKWNLVLRRRGYSLLDEKVNWNSSRNESHISKEQNRGGCESRLVL